MKQIWQYLRFYRLETVMAPLFKMLEACFELCVPLVIAAITDQGISGEDEGYILKMGAVLFALAAIGLICSAIAQYFSAKAAVGVATRLRHSLFKHIQTFSFAESDNIGTSTLITRMTSDINQVQSGVNMFLRLFLRSPFIVFGAMVMAFTINVKIAFIFVITIIVLSIVVFSIILYTIPMYKKVQGALERVLGVTRGNLMGARVIRAFGREEHEIEEYDLRTKTLFGLQVGVGKISALMNPLTIFIINAATIILIWSGAVKVDSGILTQGEVIALVSYMSQILIELVKLANLIITLTKAVACGNRLEKIFDTKSSITDGTESDGKILWNEDTEVAVEFENVSFKYDGSKENSIENCSFKVKRGSTVGIIGGTGSGKSTLVNLLPRFYDVTEGNIYINGRNVKEYSLQELRKHIGMVLQKAVLFKGTIKENLMWGNEDATEEEIKEALKISQSAEFVNNKTDGTEYMVEQGGRNLSGGQRQRLSIARAVIRRPDILILDDSSSALDFATDAALRNAIKNMNEDKNMTVFIVSQRASAIMHADNIILMDDGEIAGMGTHEELMANNEVYKEIYISQNSVR